jgi:hypothetical protein
MDFFCLVPRVAARYQRLRHLRCEAHVAGSSSSSSPPSSSKLEVWFTSAARSRCLHRLYRIAFVAELSSLELDTQFCFRSGFKRTYGKADGQISIGRRPESPGTHLSLEKMPGSM